MILTNIDCRTSSAKLSTTTTTTYYQALGQGVFKNEGHIVCAHVSM
jgi:hypothetical protein